MEIVSKAEFARQLHVSRARVSQMSGQGMPLTLGGRVNMKDAIAWMEAHVDMGHGHFSATIPDGQGSCPAVALGSTAASTASVSAAGRDSFPYPRRILLTARAKAALLAVRKAERQERRESGELIERPRS